MAAKASIRKRRKARKSGPNTRSGKAQSCRNAFRHGLTLISRNHPVYASEIEQLAKAICEDNHDPELYERAVEFAEAALTIARVRHQMAVMIDRLWDGTASTYSRGERGTWEPLDVAIRRFGDIKKIAAYYATSTKGSEGAKTSGVTIERLLDAYWQPHPIEEVGETIYKAMPDLLRLERYRRRAWSRRNRALLAFIELRNRTERSSAPVLGVPA